MGRFSRGRLSDLADLAEAADADVPDQRLGDNVAHLVDDQGEDERDLPTCRLKRRPPRRLRNWELSLDSASSTLDAAEASQSEFAGVNLDEEAAHLLEFQQAYQASARILQTAKEMFQSLIEVV